MSNLKNRISKLEIITLCSGVEIPENIQSLSVPEINELYSKLQNKYGFDKFPDIDNMSESEIDILYNQIKENK
jgi:hypothetical protein